MPVEEDIFSVSSNNSIEDSDDKINQPHVQLSDNEDGEGDAPNTLNPESTDFSPCEMPTKERLKMPWLKTPWPKKESRKRQHEKTDAQLSEAMTNLNQSIAVHN